MPDVFTLGIGVDSRPVAQAADNLDRLAASGAKSESVVTRLARSAREFAQGFRDGAREGLQSFNAGTTSLAGNSTRAARGVDQVTDKIREQGRSLSSGTSTLSKYGAVLAGAFAVNKLIGYTKAIIESADSYSTLNSRLLLATGSSEKFTAAQAALSNIADKTRTGFSETVDLFSKLTRATESLGVSQKDVLGVTETINQAMQISGTSAASASAALTQLGQAFASGALRGDELNSILEQSPRLAQAIADGMGVTTGALRELGAAGKLTADQVFGALQKSGEQISREFAALPRTVGGALTQIKNSLFELVGTLNDNAGATSILADAMSMAAEYIRDVTAAVRGLVADGSLAAWADGVRDRFNQLIESLQLVKTVLATFETQGIGAAVEAAKSGYAQMTNTGDAALARLTKMQAGLKSLNDWQSDPAPRPKARTGGGGKSGAKDAAAQRKAELDAELAVIQRGLREITSAYGAAEAIVEAQRSAGLISESEYYAKKRGFITLTSEAQLKALQDESTRLASEKAVGADRIKNQDKIADNEAKMNEIRVKSESSLRVLAIQQTSSNAAIAKSFEEARQAAQSYLDTLVLQQQRELEGMGMGQGFRDANSARNQIDDKYQAQRQELENNRALMQMEGKWTAESQAQYDRRLEIIRNFHAKARESYDDFLNHRREREQDWTLGLQEGMNNYLANARDVYKQTADATANALQSMEDALVNFVTKGKLDFRSLADSILADIARIQIRQMMTGGGKGGGLVDMIGNALASVVGGALGGAIGRGGGTGLIPGSAGVTGLTSGGGGVTGLTPPSGSFMPDFASQKFTGGSVNINSVVNATPGLNVAEFSTILDQRDMQLKTEMMDGFNRGRWGSSR